MTEWERFKEAFDRFVDAVSPVVKAFGLHMNQGSCPCNGCKIKTASAVAHRALAAADVAYGQAWESGRDAAVRELRRISEHAHSVACENLGYRAAETIAALCPRHSDCDVADAKAQHLTGDNADHGPWTKP